MLRHGTRPTVVALLGVVLGARIATAADLTIGRANGWAYVMERLVADGVDRDRVARAFAAMPPFDGLSFRPYPRESRSMYRDFLGAASVAAARRCWIDRGQAFEAAERRTGVPASVVAAIIYVESRCGRNAGSSIVLYRLARLAMANEPANLRENPERVALESADDEETAAQMRVRARFLEDTFYPEVRATFVLAARMRVDPLAIRGSSSGAFGLPQFLPTSYLRHAADGNGDGVVDLYDTADAAASCARYLADEGWQPGLSPSARRDVIWHYNHSEAYIDTVLTLARLLDDPDARPLVTASRKPARRTQRAAAHSPRRTATR